MSVLETDRLEAPLVPADAPPCARACRWLGVAFGFVVQCLFLLTVWELFWFLRDGGPPDRVGPWALGDFLLACLFAAAHSLMLSPFTRRQLTRIVPAPFYDSLFCLTTCVSLLGMFTYWRTSPTVLWEISGSAADLVRAGFYAGWAALLYSLSLTGFGWQTGWTPFWHWLRNTPPPRRRFEPRGAYRLVRHPVYLSFLALVWFTPRMTLDHAVLTAIWTAYIFYGSILKDRRLQRFIGKPYRQYAQHVSGFPLMFWGPLGKLPGDPESFPLRPQGGPGNTRTEPLSPAPRREESAA